MTQRDIPMVGPCLHCKAKPSPDCDHGPVLTADTDVVHNVVYGYTVRCIDCGAMVSDEYMDDAIRLWNGDPKGEDDG